MRSSPDPTWSRRQLLSKLSAASMVAAAAPSALLAEVAKRNDPKHRVVRVQATALKTDTVYRYGGANRRIPFNVCYVEVETADGVVGSGLTTIADARSIAAIVNQSAASIVIGSPALDTEAIWYKLYWSLMPRGQTGLAAHAVSAIDIALWDIRGKVLGQPVATLLGGARDRVPCYVTFGDAALSQEELVAAALDMQRRGFKQFKMVVGAGARERASDDMMKTDVSRIAAVRKALGDGAEIYLDANCNFNYPQAVAFAKRIAPYRIGLFEEPLTQNDWRLLADFRKETGLVLAAGQNEGLIFRFRDLLAGNAVDYVQPNVMISGGYTQAAKIAGLAQAYNVPILNGGGGSYHNLHLHAGVMNGTRLEWHVTMMEMLGLLYGKTAAPLATELVVPDVPGIGLTADPAFLTSARWRDDDTGDDGRMRYIS